MENIKSIKEKQISQNIFKGFEVEKSFANKSHLVRKVITNKAGHKQTVWVKANSDSPLKTDKRTKTGMNKNDSHQIMKISGKKINVTNVGKNRFHISNDKGKPIATIVAKDRKVLYEKVHTQVIRYFKKNKKSIKKKKKQEVK